MDLIRPKVDANSAAQVEAMLDTNTLPTIDDEINKTKETSPWFVHRGPLSPTSFNICIDVLVRKSKERRIMHKSTMKSCFESANIIRGML